MNVRKSMKEVEVLLRAKIQCIWINTYEEAEALRDLERILPRVLPNHALRVWSQTSGIVGVPLHGSSKLDRSMEDYELFKSVCKLVQADLDEHAQLQAYVFLDLSNVVNDADTRRAIRDLKEKADKQYTPFIVIAPLTSIPTDISALFRIVDYGLPEVEEIKEKIVSANGQLIKKNQANPDGGYKPLSEEEVDQAANACIGLMSKEIDMIIRESLVREKTINIDYIVNQKIESVKKSGTLDYKIPKMKLSDIGGNQAIKEWLLEQKEAFSPEAREFGLPLPKGYLGVGIPGCGKTALAEAFAGEMSWPLLELNMAKVMDSLVGESEKRIQYALDVAKASAPCVLLFDEIEKSVGGVLSSNAADSGITARVFGTMLKFLNDNSSGVYVVMTSNDVSQLPPEFTRAGRLDCIWYFGLPRREDRGSIFKIHFDKMGHPVSDILLEEAAKVSEDFTGAEIESAVKAAIRKAFKRSRKDGNTDITEEDIVAACRETIPVAQSSREKIIALENYCTSRARRSDYSPEEIRQKEEEEERDSSNYDDIFSI